MTLAVSSRSLKRRMEQERPIQGVRHLRSSMEHDEGGTTGAGMPGSRVPQTTRAESPGIPSNRSVLEHLESSTSRTSLLYSAGLGHTGVCTKWTNCLPNVPRVPRRWIFKPHTLVSLSPQTLTSNFRLEDSGSDRRNTNRDVVSPRSDQKSNLQPQVTFYKGARRACDRCREERSPLFSGEAYIITSGTPSRQ
jgi:hypothetical protein